MIVFGVCALGVGALYLAPSMARSPDQVGSPPRTQDQPTPRPRVVVTKTATAPPAPSAPLPTTVARTGPVPTVATRSATVDEPTEEPTDEESAAEESAPEESAPTKRATPKTVRRGATAVDPNRTTDDTPPAAVPKITLSAVTPDAFTVGWDAAEDNVGVVSYQVWLNGFLVATTEGLQATVDWFNDDGGQHVVQVRAVDAAGNQSTDTPTVLVTRPEPIALTVTPSSPTPDPTPTATPTPTTSPTPSVTPTDQLTSSPDPGDPSDEGAEDAAGRN